MNRIAIIIGLLFFVYNGMSQRNPLLEQEKDSIQILIDETTGASEKIEKYKEAMKYFARSNRKLVFEFAQAGLDLAIQNKEYKHQVGFYYSIGLSYIIFGDFNKAMEHYKKGLQLAKQHGFNEDYLLLKHRVASLWIKQGRKDVAAQLLDSIVGASARENLLNVEFMAAIELGKLERINGSFDKSLAWFNMALEVAKKQDNQGKISYALLQLGIDYSETDEHQKAIAINKKGITICLESKNYIRANQFYNNIAICYRDNKQYDSALIYHYLVLEKTKLEQDQIAVANICLNIGTTYALLVDMEKAEIYYDSAYIIMKDKKGHPLLDDILQNMASFYMDVEKFNKALDFGLLALAYTNQKKQTRELPGIYETIYQSYKGLSRNDSALFYFELMTAINDSIYNIDKYNSTEHIKREIESAEKQQEINELQYSKKRDRLFLLSAIGALSSFVLIVFLFMRNMKRKKELAEEHQKLEEQRVLTLIQEQEINVVNSMIKGQEKECQKISDELHDNLGSNLATLKLHIENLLNNKKLDKKNKNEILQKSCGLLDETYQKVREMSHVKSTGMVAQKGLVLALEKLSQQISSKGNIDVSIDVFGFEKIASNPLKILLYNTIQELLTNAIKHAKASQINIQITQHESELNVLVEDNGSGFSYSEKTLENGLGLYNIKNKIEHLKGTFNVDSILGHGTTININIPL